MKSEIQKTETGITAAQIETLVQAGVIPSNVPKPIIEVFMAVCNKTNLSPFLKQIYLVGYYSKSEQKTIYSNIVGIDGMRSKGQETNLFAGVDDPKFNLLPDGKFNTAAQIKASGKDPVSCTVTVYKIVGNMRCPFTKTVLFAEYCPENRKQKWATMPLNMIAKCAESGALKMAFAVETAGLSIEEEGAAYQDITIQAAAQNPAVAVDEKELEERLSLVFSAAVLLEIYNENPAHASDFAHLFTARKNEVEEMIANGQMKRETWEAKPEKTIAI
jgi:phage recombination protein Bet